MDELENKLNGLAVGETMAVDQQHMVVVTVSRGDVWPCKTCYYKRTEMAEEGKKEEGKTKTGCTMHEGTEKVPHIVAS